MADSVDNQRVVLFGARMNIRKVMNVLLVFLTIVILNCHAAPAKKIGPCVGEACLQELMHDPDNPHHHEQELLAQLDKPTDDAVPVKPLDRMEELHNQLMHDGSDNHDDVPEVGPEIRAKHGPRDVFQNEKTKTFEKEVPQGADVPQDLMDTLHETLMHADGSNHDDEVAKGADDVKVVSSATDPDVLMHGGKKHDHEIKNDPEYKMDPELVWKKEKRNRNRNKPAFSLKYITDAIMDEIDSLKSRWSKPATDNTNSVTESESQESNTNFETETESQSKTDIINEDSKTMKNDGSEELTIPSAEKLEDERIVEGRVLSSRQKAMMQDEERKRETMRKPLHDEG